MSIAPRTGATPACLGSRPPSTRERYRTDPDQSGSRIPKSVPRSRAPSGPLRRQARSKGRSADGQAGARGAEEGHAAQAPDLGLTPAVDAHCLPCGRGPRPCAAAARLTAELGLDQALSSVSGLLCCTISGSEWLPDEINPPMTTQASDMHIGIGNLFKAPSASALLRLRIGCPSAISGTIGVCKELDAKRAGNSKDLPDLPKAQAATRLPAVRSCTRVGPPTAVGVYFTPGPTGAAPVRIRLDTKTLCLAAWLPGSLVALAALAASLPGCLAARAAWLSGCLAAWLPGCLPGCSSWPSGQFTAWPLFAACLAACPPAVRGCLG